MFCKYCGGIIEDDSAFCKHCGKKLSSSSGTQTSYNTSSSSNGYSTNSQNRSGSENEKKWYFYTNNSINGPFSANELKTYIHSGTFTSSCKVICDGMPEPQMACFSELRDLFAQVEVDQSVLLKKVSCRYAWMMATIPIAASIVVGLIFGSWIAQTIVAIVLNCIFMRLDSREIEDSGVDMEQYIWLGFTLIPVYLFIRSSKIDQNFGYSITWCIMFVISLFF